MLEAEVIQREAKSIQADKWKHRRHKDPIRRDDGLGALELVLDEYDCITEYDDYAEEDCKYHQKQGKLKGAWIIGSMAAGRWTKASDVDVWLCIKGLSDYAYDNLDWHVKENLQEKGVTVTAEDGTKRAIDVLIMNYRPAKDYPAIRLL